MRILNVRSYRFVGFLFPLISILIIVFLGFYSAKSHKKRNEFELINSCNSVNIRVTRQLGGGTARCYIITQMGDKLQLPWADNMSYSPKHLAQFVQKGDSIYKTVNSDTIYIFRGSEKYHFILEKRIWE